MSSILSPLFQIHPQDTVAITLIDLYPNMTVDLRTKQFHIHENIPSGHKIALQNIADGEPVLRYGWSIGVARSAIKSGEWVHTHNLGIANYERDFSAKTTLHHEKHNDNFCQLRFNGYLRANGSVGTRNYVAIISAVNCVNPIVRAIQQSFDANMLSAFPNIDGVLAITHDSGCSLPTDGLDHENLQRVLINMTQHPNIADCLVIGLGCEVNQMEAVLEPFGIPFLNVQDEGGSQSVIEKGRQIVVSQLTAANTVERTSQPLSKLRLALQCGGSDAFSGITGNPLLGEISDRLAAAQGSVVIAETTEIFGAEQLLLARAASPLVEEKLRRILNWWQEYTQQMGVTVDNNPSPGNKAGGLTTIFEKSLGAISKCGSTDLSEVLNYGELSQCSGVAFMDSPGNDAVSLTGQLAAGCNLVLFTTGRGTTYAPGIAPCLKVATTSDLYQRMTGDMDTNAGLILEGQTLRQAGDALLQTIIATASGQTTKNEMLIGSQVELFPWRRGAIL